jgi:uncharacterized protein encoded in toxicity protection region of plasmid R478, contains von willebrand factor (VWF) domain
MADKLKIPGGALANRPLHFFWMVDCSSSMAGDRIGAVNHAIQECIEPMREEAAGNPNAQLYIHTLKFASGASWVTAEPVPIEEFAWEDVEASGITDMGKAFELLAGQLSMPPMPDRALPPVIVLLTDGYPTDDWKRPMEKLLKMPWGKKAVKVAIAIGKDAERSVLEAFTGNPEAVLDAGNPEVLTHFIKWASTVASAVSNPTSNPMEVGDVQETEQSSQETQEPRMLNGNITLPDLDDVNVEEVW